MKPLVKSSLSARGFLCPYPVRGLAVRALAFMGFPLTSKSILIAIDTPFNQRAVSDQDVPRMANGEGNGRRDKRGYFIISRNSR